MRKTGKLTAWNDDKGFGFITPVGGDKQVFVHVKAFGNRNRRPVINQLVTYCLSVDKQGRPCAVNARLAGARLHENIPRRNSSTAVMVAASFLILVVVASLAAKIPPLIPGLYVVASLLTFWMYAADKSAARKGASRTPENTLHLLSLAGGWPGALVAQQKFRHKTMKPSFRSVFRITVLLNCSAFLWLLTPNGAAALRQLLSGVA
jgi:uncharacterized membrane protein YsdA (DUF1294 family)/cold shock CspA family protein